MKNGKRDHYKVYYFFIHLRQKFLCSTNGLLYFHIIKMYLSAQQQKPIDELRLCDCDG